MPLEKHPTKPDTLVFRGHPAARLNRHACFGCGGLFDVGDLFHSDAPNVVYHLRCYIAEVKQVRSTSNSSQES